MTGNKFTITFDNGRDTLKIGRGTDCGIVDYEGFDGTNFDVEIEEYQFDGGKIKRQRAGSRSLMVHFRCDSTLAVRKHEFYRFFDLHNNGYLVVNNQNIERGIPYVVSSLQDKQGNQFRNLEFELQMKSPNAYFEDPDYHLEEMTSWVGGFTLPTDLPFSLRHRGVSQAVIINDGDVDTPVWIQFKGPATSPKVSNLTTGLHVQVATELTENQTLHIKTNENKPEVLIEEDGVFTNGYPIITQATSLEFELVKGDNLLKYESADSSQINQVNVLYKNLYVGI